MYDNRTLKAGSRVDFRGLWKGVDVIPAGEELALALGANAVGEICFGMIREENFHLVPRSFGITNLLAPRTHRKYSAQSPDFRERRLEIHIRDTLLVDPGSHL